MSEACDKIVMRAIYPDGKHFLIVAPLVFDERGRPFMVYEHWLKKGRPLFDCKIALEYSRLRKLDPPQNGANYAYSGEFQLPRDEEN
jgi:hypothetical protein